MNLDELKNDWQAQTLEATEPKLEMRSLKSKFRDQLKSFERDHNPQTVMVMGIVMSVFALLGLIGWVIKGNPFSQLVSFSFGGTALFQFLRYYATRKRPEPDTDIRAYLEQSLRQLRWHRYSVYVVSLIGGFPMLSFSLLTLLQEWASIDNATLFALLVYLCLAVVLVGVIFWYQKRFMYDTIRLKKEIKTLLAEYKLKES
ncbi:MAG: hypothetical protein AAF927_14740 [Bacteroidota bacterium]